MVDESKRAIPVGVKFILANTTMYSFRASASEDSLLQDAVRRRSLNVSSVTELVEAAMRSPVRSAILKYFWGSESGPIQNSTFRFHRTLLTDDDLAPAAVNELTRRRALNKPNAHVVLIAEWDSFYGRAAMARLFLN